MLNSNLPEPELMKAILEPLLEDFQYWFARMRSLLETEDIQFLGHQEQRDLLERVQQAQQAVSATQSLFLATNGQVGVESSVLMTWHQLVTQCWQVMVQFRLGDITEK